MRCQDCIHWTAGAVIPFTDPEQRFSYGLCKPPTKAMPFWAARKLPDMQTRTLPSEGRLCGAYAAVAN